MKHEKLILGKDAKVLRQKAKAVLFEDIGTEKLGDVIAKMKKALHTEEDGVAIAAPQIGESLRIFIIKGVIISKQAEDLVFINPELVKTSKKNKKMEEGCLSLRYLYGKVLRHEKVTISAYNEHGKKITRGASGLLAQIFQHEIDHLNGILFIDKAEEVRDVPPLSFVFFGSSQLSKYVLEELERAGHVPIMKIASAKAPLPKLPEADLFIVASFGKILPREVIDMPKYGSLNVHPSLLPELRGPSPIQNLILQNKNPGVTIIKMDDKMDHGPIVAQEKVSVIPFPDHYDVLEEKLARAGGKLLVKIIPNLPKPIPQDNSRATYTKLVKKEEGLLNLEDDAQVNLRKVLAYSTWPGAYLLFKRKTGKEIRVVVKDAEVKEGKFTPTKVIPAGKREMDWQDFLRGN
ncbi:MAG: peptide deformylase [Patescibacteria group bacterium]